MKYYILLIISIILSSCNLFQDIEYKEPPLQFNHEEKQFDYYIGELFEIDADSAAILKDNLNNRYYELWFSGPIVEKRLSKIECEYDDNPTITKAIVNFTLITESNDSININHEIIGCIDGASYGKTIYIGPDSLVFYIELLYPNPETHNEYHSFKEYVARVKLEPKNDYPQVIGKFVGTSNSTGNDVILEITFNDSTYFGLDGLSFGGYSYICQGPYYQSRDELLISNYCGYDTFMGDVFAFPRSMYGIYYYEFNNYTLRMWNTRGWEYIFEKKI